MRNALGPIFLIMAAGAFAGPATAQDAKDRVIAPDRIGAVTTSSTPAQLRRVYGAKNVRVGKHSNSDEEFEGVVVYPGRSDEVRVYYNKGRTRMEAAEVGSKPSTWRTRDGLRVGLKLAEVERIVGGSLLLEYSEESGGGFRSQERKGKLLGLILKFRTNGNLTQAELNRIHSGRSMRSDHPLVRKAALTVHTIQVPFDPQ